MNRLAVDAIIRAALLEDLGGGDVTTALLPEAGKPARATLLAREAGVLCGGGVAARCFTLLDDAVEATLRIPDSGTGQLREAKWSFDARAYSIQ